jgi:hypothetical protein
LWHFCFGAWAPGYVWSRDDEIIDFEILVDLYILWQINYKKVIFDIPSVCIHSKVYHVSEQCMAHCHAATQEPTLASQVRTASSLRFLTTFHDGQAVLWTFARSRLFSVRICVHMCITQKASEGPLYCQSLTCRVVSLVWWVSYRSL